MATLEAAGRDAEEKGNTFWAKVLQRQHQRLKGVYDRHIVRLFSFFFLSFFFLNSVFFCKDEQVHAIEQTKLTTKKRKGVAQFIKYFPVRKAKDLYFFVLLCYNIFFFFPF